MSPPPAFRSRRHGLYRNQRRQHFRDARITTIYEGTTAIQANDLIGRKVAREGGSSLAVLLADIDATREQLLASGNAQLSAIGAALARGAGALAETRDWLLAHYASQPAQTATGAVAFLKLTWRGGRRLDDGRAAAIAAHRSSGRWRQRHGVPERQSWPPPLLRRPGAAGSRAVRRANHPGRRLALALDEEGF